MPATAVAGGVQTQALSSDCPYGVEIGQRRRYNGVLGGGKWVILRRSESGLSALAVVLRVFIGPRFSGEYTISKKPQSVSAIILAAGLVPLALALPRSEGTVEQTTKATQEYFAFVYRRGPGWDPQKDIWNQPSMDEHIAWVTKLEQSRGMAKCSSAGPLLTSNGG